MNRSSSSNIQKKKCSQVPGMMELKKSKMKQSIRNPLQQVNKGKDSNSSSSSGSGSLSSSVSVEASGGCLRFFLSHSSSARTPFNNCRPAKALVKTPKSAPFSRPSKSLPKSKPFVKQNYLTKRAVSETPISHRLGNVKKWQSVNKPSSKIGQNSNDCSFLDSNLSSADQLASGCGESLKQPEELQFTPLSKLVTGSGLDCVGVVDNDKVMDNEKSKGSGSTSSKTITPPIQSSLSPEIQCGSTVVSTKVSTPVCYAAGHVISGITDKRKCRPRGILAVGDYGDTSSFGRPKALYSFDDADHEDGHVGIDNNPRVSIVPLPAEASMHWLLSPCNEEDEDKKENSDIRSSQLQGLVEPKTLNSPSSLLSGLAFSLDLCNISTHGSGATNGSTSGSGRKYLPSPSEVPQFRQCLDSLCENVVVVSSSPNVMPCYGAGSLKEEGKQHDDFDGVHSPFSVDSLGSENVIQTPQSDIDSERLVGASCLSANDPRKHTIDFELNTAAEDFQRASLSLKSHVSIWDPTNSSFQCEHLPSLPSSADFTQFQKVLGGQALWTSDSTLETLSQSQMRISWRDSLASQILEMDDLDNCRCLSDEEEDLKITNNNPLKSCQNPKINVDSGNDSILKDAFGSTEFVDGEQGAEGRCKERLPSLLKHSCAESISTDGGGLVSSEDSNWSLCYKNSLFEI
ncbi:hypothetical protein SLE2022_106320 [Rubroshorea leprosula]